MALGVIAKKCGMTRIFDKESGASIPVSVLHVKPNKVTQCKTKEKEGYSSVQVTRGEQKPQRLTKSQIGHFAKAKVVPGEGLWEFRLESEDNVYEMGTEFAADLFQVGQYVDVTGVTKGRGFSGSIRRHHFRSQRASHGNSISHRAPGSIGQNQSPGRVFKGKKMAGQHGHARRTTQNLKVIQVDTERQVLLIQGAVPGATGGFLMVRPAVKRKRNSNDAK